MKGPASLGAAATGRATDPRRPKRSESAPWPPRGDAKDQWPSSGYAMPGGKLLLRAMDADKPWINDDRRKFRRQTSDNMER